MNAFLKHLLDPVLIKDFFNDYYEKDMVHIERNDPEYYNSVLTSEDLSSFLDRQDIFYPSLRIVKNGKEIPSSQYTYKGVPIGHHKRDGIINTSKMFSLFNEGSTLVIQGGQRYFENLSKFCQGISQKFNSPVQANLYITPNKSQGFNPHWDTHDVFVLQISGTKTWKLYGFEKELPTKNQTFVSKDYAKDPIQTCQLKPGDFLYVPRGYVHDAIADDGISAHITVGVLSFTWSRLFNEVFTQLEEFKEFREAVPFWNDDLTEIIQQKKAFLKQKIDELDMEKGFQKLTSTYHKTQPQPLNNYFHSLLDLQKTADDTRYALNEHVIYRFSKEEDVVKVKFLDKEIILQKSFEDLLDWIFTHKEFSPQELPEGLEEERKSNLVNKLVAEGMLFIKNL